MLFNCFFFRGIFLGFRSFTSFIAFYRTLVSANNFVSQGYFILTIFRLFFFFLDSSVLIKLLFFSCAHAGIRFISLINCTNSELK